MTKYRPTIILLVLLLISGCCGPQSKSEPELAYLVAYSILDKRFNTSTRLDLTADILNETNESLEMTQLTLTDSEGATYTLDYETIPKFSQEGRYNAIPLVKPIEGDLLGGQSGINYDSPGGLKFLFINSFESAVIQYRNSKGIQELEVKNLAEIILRSRQETISWMEKEHEERERTLTFLKEKAEQRISERKTKK